MILWRSHFFGSGKYKKKKEKKNALCSLANYDECEKLIHGVSTLILSICLYSYQLIQVVAVSLRISSTMAAHSAAHPNAMLHPPPPCP